MDMFALHSSACAPRQPRLSLDLSICYSALISILSPSAESYSLLLPTEWTTSTKFPSGRQRKRISACARPTNHPYGPALCLGRGCAWYYRGATAVCERRSGPKSVWLRHDSASAMVEKFGQKQRFSVFAGVSDKIEVNNNWGGKPWAVPNQDGGDGEDRQRIAGVSLWTHATCRGGRVAEVVGKLKWPRC